MVLIQLFFEFFKAGLFAIGGGLATLPFLYDIANRTDWFTASDVTNLIAISESTPGPIGVNAATYVGFLTHGISGAVIATLGLIAPAIIIIIIVSRMLKSFKQSPLVQSVFYGLRPASTALIASAGVLVIKNAFFVFSSNGISVLVPNIILAALLFLAVMKTKFHPAFYILVSAVIGIIFKL